MKKNQTYSVGYLPFAPGCSFKPRTIGCSGDLDGRAFFYGGYVSLHLVLSGTGDISWNDQRRELSPGDMFCILPDIKVRYTNTPEAPWSFCWIDVIGPAAEEIARQAGFTASEPTRRNLPHRELLRDKFDYIHTLAGTDESDPCVYARLILDLLSLLSEPHVKRSHESAVEEFEKLLQDPRNIAMNINDCSAALHLDRTTLFLACRKYRQESPVRMLIRQKIRFCEKLLLAYPQYTLKKIALMSGFANEASLCRAFRRETHDTPAGYRKKMRKEL